MHLQLRFVPAAYMLVFCLVAQENVSPIPSPNSGLCKIIVVDQSGNTIVPVEISLHQIDDPKQTLAWRESMEIPYGSYRMTVSSSGFKRFHGVLIVNQPRQKVVVCLHLPPIGEDVTLEQNPTYGRLIGNEIEKCDGLIVFPVFCSTGSVSALHTVYRGGFGFDHLDPGLYTFVFLAGTKPCLTRTVRVPYKPRQVINIATSPE